MAGIPLQNAKIVQMVKPVDTNGATQTDVEVDTAGYDYLTVIVSTGNVAADMTTLKLQESNSSGASEADFTGGAFTAPAGTGGDNNVLAAFIDLRKRKRYISIVVTGGAAATLISVVGILTNAEVSPTSVTERGLNEQLIP